MDVIVDDSWSRRIRIGMPANRPQRYVFYAYVSGDIDYQEAHSILTTKYHYGKRGAAVALQYAKQYPHRISKPADYDKIFSEGLTTGAAEQFGGR